jgi:hypothetical protein
MGCSRSSWYRETTGPERKDATVMDLLNDAVELLEMLSLDASKATSPLEPQAGVESVPIHAPEAT